MTPAKINEIFRRFAEKQKEPKTELKYVNEYTLLVAVVLSAQQTDVGVNKATESLFKIADTPKKMLKLGEEGLKNYIAKINFFRGKAKNIITLSHILLEKHNGEVPKTREALEELPGVGKKTASVILNTLFGEATIAVDTHVFRVANRTGLVKTTNPHDTQIALEKKIPAKWKIHAHHWLILHGRYICVARKPKCYECLIADLCEYRDKNLTPPAAKLKKSPK